MDQTERRTVVFNMGYGYMVEFKRLMLTLFFAFFGTNMVCGDVILDRKVIPGKNYSGGYTPLIELFICDNNESALFDSAAKSFYMHDKWVNMAQYGQPVNAFTKDNLFQIAFKNNAEIAIYEIQKEVKLFERCTVVDESCHVKKVIPSLLKQSSYCYFGDKKRLPANPLESLRFFTSGGHGYLYTKPFLAECNKDGKINKFQDIDYGGNIDESYVVEEIVVGNKLIHCLGFRHGEELNTNYPTHSEFILYYAGYDPQKRKTVQSFEICKRTPAKEFFSPLSIVTQQDNVFITFACSKFSPEPTDIEARKSEIYYYQYCDKLTSAATKIAEGFLPLVRINSTGKVFVFWIDYNGQLMMKIRKDDKWNDGKVVETSIDLYPGIRSERYISAEFDAQDNLHLVFPSKGNLVYEKIKLDTK